MNLSKFISMLWSFMAARNKFWGATRSPEQLTIREFKVLRNESTDFRNVEFARKILTMMFTNLKKRGRPVRKDEEDRNVA